MDCEGTKNLVAAAQQAGVKKFVHVTSIGCDDPLFPLNAFFGVLFWKKQVGVGVRGVKRWPKCLGVLRKSTATWQPT